MKAPTRRDLEQYANDGFLVVPAMLTPSECETFLECNRAYFAEGRWSGLDTHTRDRCFDAIIAHDDIVTWARALLGGDIACVQTLTFAKPPGAKGIAFHQESYYIATDPPDLLTCWVALEESTEANGGLVLVPGSHRRGLLPVHAPENLDEHVEMRDPFVYHDRSGRHWEETLIAGEIRGLRDDECVTPHIDAGSVIFFDGRTIHGSAKNRSGADSRHAFSAHYVRRDTWVFRTDIACMRAV